MTNGKLLVASLSLAALFSVGYAESTTSIQVGVRPYYLVNDMDEGILKSELQKCANNKKSFKKSDFSIGHRGACMQFPEHTKESYVAAAQMGAGILECDVTFTKDKELVCRHSQCDLHTTTNILETPLASKCSQPFKPYDGKNDASAKCCTSDITLEEFKTLKGKMDAGNPKATSVAEYLDATPRWRTDRYSGTGTLVTHKESIELFKSLGVKMTPELKEASVAMPFDGLTQEAYAQKMINEYKEAGVKPSSVFAQSFNYNDILYWIKKEPKFGKQAVFLDETLNEKKDNYASDIAEFDQFKKDGVKILAPALRDIVKLDSNGKIVPNEYAIAAKAKGFEIITWSLERSGLLKSGGGWYYETVTNGINNDGDTYTLLDVLAKDVGVKGVFSDWAGTTTFYANCKNIK